MVQGGIIVLDDYGIFPGAIEATDRFMRGRPERSETLLALAPSFVVVQ